MKRITVPNVLLVMSIVVWGVVVSSIIVNVLWIPNFEEVGHLQVGCYRTDALWFYVKCQGFVGSGAAAFVLTLPYLLWPLLLVLNPFLALLWFFLLFPAWYI
jgi:hypothetical protein